MPGCKPGDDAVIIKTPKGMEACMGVLVKVVEYCPMSPLDNSKLDPGGFHGPWFHITSANPLLKGYITLGAYDIKVGNLPELYGVSDECLQPLRKDSTPKEEEIVKEIIKCDELTTQ